ncbi:Kynurenine formamidase [compost metagenome]
MNATMKFPMTPRLSQRLLGLILMSAGSLAAQAHGTPPRAAASAQAPVQQVGGSPWGPDDEIGRLNLITPESRAAILSRVKGDKVYDLATDYYVGMPSWQDAGDPKYQFWMTHTPRGTVVDDPMSVGQDMNAVRSYTGTAFSMYSHTGTHIDALNHFGIHGKIWNGFSADEHLGDRGWKRTGIEKFPPLIARGVMIDVAALKGVDELPDQYRITRQDLKAALARQKTTLQRGDIVLIRTGRMKRYDDPKAYMANPPGMGLDAARYLVEEGGAMIVGADNLSFESFPSEVADDYVPLHTYLLAQQGVPIIELIALDGLSRDQVYEFAFIGGPLKIRGGDAAPLRPVAIPLR